MIWSERETFEHITEPLISDHEIEAPDPLFAQLACACQLCDGAGYIAQFRGAWPNASSARNTERDFLSFDFHAARIFFNTAE